MTLGYAGGMHNLLLLGSLVFTPLIGVACSSTTPSNASTAVSGTGGSGAGGGSGGSALGDVDTSKTAPAKGTLSYFSVETADVPYTADATSPCNFYFDGATETVTPGKVWLAFDCPIIADASTGSTCAIQSGHAVFEDCKE